MKLHPIFKDYPIWWGAMAILSLLKFYIFGIPTGLGYEKHGIIFNTWHIIQWFYFR
jgi:hypothetical protein